MPKKLEGEYEGQKRGGWSPELPEAGAASWTNSGWPAGLGLAPCVSYLLGQPGHPHPASRTPSLRAKVRAVHGHVLIKSQRAMTCPEFPTRVPGAKCPSEPSEGVLGAKLVSEWP